MRHTKIITTIGPATFEPAVLQQLIEAGADVFRFNLKHNTPEWHQSTIDNSRDIAKKLGKNLSIVIDVPQPELASTVTGADFVALSYITSSNDITKFKNTQIGTNPPKIIAKIENKTALINLESIIDTADAVMIARGDLAKDIPFEHLAFWQKKIITSCRLKSRPVIVATEMLESMIKNPTPTRAEATDVANAVFDGTDAIMLSGETAMGRYPVEAVKIMASIASFCDSQSEVKTLNFATPSPTDQLIKSAATIVQSSKDKIKAVIVFSQSGSTVRQLAAYRMLVPIVAITNNSSALPLLNLSRGVVTHFDDLESGDFQLNAQIFTDLLSYPFLTKGDMVLVIHGNNWFSSGSTSDLSLKTL